MAALNNTCGDFLMAFEQGCWAPKQPSAFIPLQHGLCLSVTCTGMFFTSHFQVEKISVTEVPNLSQSRFKDCPQHLEVLHKILYEEFFILGKC